MISRYFPVLGHGSAPPKVASFTVREHLVRPSHLTTSITLSSSIIAFYSGVSVQRISRRFLWWVWRRSRRATRSAWSTNHLWWYQISCPSSADLCVDDRLTDVLRSRNSIQNVEVPTHCDSNILNLLMYVNDSDVASSSPEASINKSAKTHTDNVLWLVTLTFDLHGPKLMGYQDSSWNIICQIWWS